MSDFKFPANIKQIGSICDGLNIYMEDYVSSYLNQYAEQAGYEERLALLLGKYMIVDSKEILFISGAIQGKYCENKNGILTFSEKTWSYAKEQIETFFPDLEVLGWMQSQPSYGVFLNSSYSNYHLKNFTKPYQVLFVNDPIEKVNSFYIYNKTQSDLTETTGYFVYYDKNKKMHEYMVENRLVKSVVPPVKKISTNSQNNKIPVSPHIEHEATKQKKPWVLPVVPEDIIDDSTRHKKVQVRIDKSIIQQKRLVNMLVGLSALLFVIAFIMGAGLMQNEDRITSLEKDIHNLSASYKNILANSKETPVFASQDKNNSATLIVEDGNAVLAENDLKKEQASSISDEDLNPVLEIVNQNNLKDKNSELEANLEAVEAPVVKETVKPTIEPTTESTLEPATKAVEKTVTESVTKESIDKKTSTIPKSYKVQKGDSLIYISTKFYGSRNMTKAIMELNNLDNPNKIIFGKVLLLPQIDE